jgi:hypothetical protein
MSASLLRGTPLRLGVARVVCVALALLLPVMSAHAADQEQRQRDSVRSFIGTAEMALDAWLTGTVPAHFARRTLEAMRERLIEISEQQTSSVQVSSHPDSSTENLLRPAIETLGRAQDALETSNHEAVIGQLKALRETSALVDAGRHESPPQ